MTEIKRHNGKLVLGDGEVTGHQHTIRDKSARMFRINVEDRALNIPDGATLRHERGDVPAEHRDIILPVGEPVVTTKRQYIPEGWTPVLD